MAGGNWSVVDTLDPSVRTGFYVNFLNTAGALLQPGANGIVAVAVTASWGPVSQIVDCYSANGTSDVDKLFGTLVETATGMVAASGLTATVTPTTNVDILVREALRNATQVRVYRMAPAAVAAKVTLKDTTGTPVNSVDVSGKYVGSRGNGFTVTIVTNTVDTTKKDFKVYEGSVLIEKATFASTANDLITSVNALNSGAGSNYVTAALTPTTGVGTATLAAVTGAALAGGTSGAAVTAADFTGAMNAFGAVASSWNVFTAGIEDTAIQSSIYSWVQGLRTNGDYVTAVLGASSSDTFTLAVAKPASFNYEGIVFHYIPVVINMVPYSAAQFSGRIAGMVAGAGPYRSITYAVVNVIDNLNYTNPLTPSQIKQANGSGMVTAFMDGSITRIEKGVNTLTTLNVATQNNGWRKPKVIAIMDTLTRAIQRAVNTDYLGKLPNDEAGQSTLIGAVKSVLDFAIRARLIKAGTESVATDTAYPAAGDSYAMVIGYTPVDSVEKVFATIKVGR